jgi:CRISPR/Cas system Type II protein with McrA/HNH and RuvC-like nuclease domain
MGSSHDITKLLQNVSEDDEVKSSFLKGIKNVESFLNKVKLVLLDRNVEGGREETDKFFNNELTLLFRAQRQIRAFKRTKQDFYILWYLISPINLEMIKFFRLQIKQDLHEIFYKLKNNLTEFTKEDFVSISKHFHLRYSIEHRQTRLSEAQKNIMIKEQANSCPISEAPLFIGDDIEVDHTIPISLGGKDSIDNLQITHKDSNRKKGSKNSF